jgi:UDP-N-acetylmuramate dehydrogenase
LKEFYEKLKKIITEGQILRDEPLSNHTTFRIGGPCDFFVIADTQEEFTQVIRLCKQEEVPCFIIGNGSNLLVADEGLSGVVLRLNEDVTKLTVEEKGEKTIVTACAGINLSNLAMKIANLSLTGFEFAAGIPGTLGGAIYMNAGAYGGEIKDCILSARVVSPEGEIIEFSKDDLKLSYRSSSIQKSGYSILSASFEFKKGDYAQIHSCIEDLNRQRREKQPLEFPSAGSTFKRPEGYFAGKLIMDAGLRGYRVGDAMVSEKHCGFVINVGNATAKDVMQLLTDVQRIVKEKFGVTIEPEVKLISKDKA